MAGLLDLRDEGYGFLRLNGVLPSRDDVYVSVKQVRQFGMRKGDRVTGASRPANRNEKNPALLRVDTVNDMDPEKAKARPRFEDLTPLLHRLSADGPHIDPSAPTDEAKRPVQGSWRHPRKTLSPVDMIAADNPDRFRHPRSGDTFVRMVKNKPAMEQLADAEHAARVMPKGRNFH